jgi:hypothetical protein
VMPLLDERQRRALAGAQPGRWGGVGSLWRPVALV